MPKTPKRARTQSPRRRRKAAKAKQRTPPPPTYPPVCFIEDLVVLLRMSRTGIERLRRYGTFPIEEIPGLDSRPRWSGERVRRFVEANEQKRRSSWRKFA